MVLCQVSLFAALVSSANAIKINQNKKLLPFDCYVDNGKDYQGLMDSSGTGRKCKNWRDADVAGMGNNNFCRNPKGEKDRPWCHTIDPEAELALENIQCFICVEYNVWGCGFCWLCRWTGNIATFQNAKTLVNHLSRGRLQMVPSRKGSSLVNTRPKMMMGSRCMREVLLAWIIEVRHGG